jgi:retron-type reverse transcriptase
MADDFDKYLRFLAPAAAAVAALIYGLTRRPNKPKPLPKRDTFPNTADLSLPQSFTFRSVTVPAQPGHPASPAPARKTLNLETPDFTPISGAEAKKLASGIGSAWRNPFFGRRDLIPPATDPRTSVIDRAMVGQGLITPEELTELHKIGDQMEQVRPDLARVHHVADQAVKQDREERERLKQQKKAESAERKRLRAEAVAKRKQTDIFFLGRGVSKGLSDRRSNVEKLQAQNLPILATPSDVAQALGITIPRLRWLAHHSEAAGVTHYIRFTIPKKSGGTRNLSAPHRDLAAAQEWILTNILKKIPTHNAAHGFVPTRSTLTNAKPHVNRHVVVNTDLENFFPTITFPRVAGIFRQLGYSPAAAAILALLCTECPRRQVIYAGKIFHVATGPRALPQGACTSPALSNLAARRMDSRLAGIAIKLNWTYTRYADDLSFSADKESADKVGYLLARVRHIAQDEGFAVNETKTRVLRQAAAQSVTGIIVNQRPNIPRKQVRRIRAILHRAKTEGLKAQNKQNLPHFDSWLRGMIAYIHMVNPQQAKPLRESYQALAMS